MFQQKREDLISFKEILDVVLILYLLGISIALLPVFMLLYLGPSPRIERIVYMITGLLSAGFVGLILFLISIHKRFEDPNSLGPRLLRFSLAGLLEELFRFPAILFAQFIGTYIALKMRKRPEEIRASVVEQKVLWTEISDPKGLGMYFGIGWGMGETLAFYVGPAILDYLNDIPWNWRLHVFALLIRLTAVMAHTALTFMALIITVNRSFYRLTISLHIGVNIFNEIFGVIAPIERADDLVGIFTRFSLVLIALYLLRPKSRYMTPAILLFYQVVMFLVFILIGTLIYLFYWILNQSAILEAYR